jgi:hypothetical protein
MAKGLVMMVVLMVAGCQQQRPASMVDPLPAPNFGGPSLPPLASPPMAQAPPVYMPPPRPPVQPLPPVAATPGVPRDWVPVAAANQWNWIVIHHSATSIGGAARINKWHRDKGWDELGYHFVIGNGTDTPNGQVEVGSRWPKQKWGAHAKTPDNQFNEHGIGICLVGNFDLTRPSDAQMKSLARLVTYLMRTYRVPADHIIGHSDTKPTECPGRNLHVATLRRMCAQMIADGGGELPRYSRAMAGEMLIDAGHR